MKIFLVAMVSVGSAFAGERMAAARQNELVAKYCTVCHTDASMNGGLSLEHFDAANADPNLAAMMVSKLKGGALGASGRKLPDRPTQDALQDALTEESAGWGEWTFRTKGGMSIATVVKAAAGTDNLYQLTVTCSEEARQASLQLAWSPGVPDQGREIGVSFDGKFSTYKVEGHETMGNGQTGLSGPGSLALRGSIPEKSLTVNKLFGDQSVEFTLGEPVLRRLAACRK